MGVCYERSEVEDCEEQNDKAPPPCSLCQSTNYTGLRDSGFIATS